MTPTAREEVNLKNQDPRPSATMLLADFLTSLAGWTCAGLSLVLFVVVHVAEVAAAGFVGRVRSMITGR